MRKILLFGIIFLLLIFAACSQQQPIKQPDVKTPAQNAEKENLVEKVVVQPKGSPLLTIISPKGTELIKSSKITVEMTSPPS